jgi:parvulin-like peptidyl-prolyl isomerase
MVIRQKPPLAALYANKKVSWRCQDLCTSLIEDVQAMNRKMRMLCLAILLMGLGAWAEEAGDPTDNNVVNALKEVQAAKAAKNKAVKTADQLLAFLPPVVATYGGKSISADEIRAQIKPKLQIRLQAAAGRLAEAEVKKMVFEQASQMIDDEILRQLAEKAGIKPDLDGAKRKIEDDIEKNPVAETMFAAQGLTIAQAIRNQAWQQLREDWVKAVIVPQIVPAEAEILASYNERFANADKPESRQISHILIKSDPGDAPDKKAAARKKCEDLLVKVKAGGNFVELAKKYSDCPSRSKGGSLGEQTNNGGLVKEFSDVAFKLEEGATSDVVQTQFGYHIIRVDMIIQAGKPPLDKVKKDIVEHLAKDKTEELAKKTMEDARQAAAAKINL